MKSWYHFEVLTSSIMRYLYYMIMLQECGLLRPQICIMLWMCSIIPFKEDFLIPFQFWMRVIKPVRSKDLIFPFLVFLLVTSRPHPQLCLVHVGKLNRGILEQIPSSKLWKSTKLRLSASLSVGNIEVKENCSLHNCSIMINQKAWKAFSSKNCGFFN